MSALGRILRKPVWIAAFAGVLLLGAGAAYFVWRMHHPPSNRVIDEQAYVTLGGVEQYISITGESRSNPVLLFLHGGPGRSMLGFDAEFRPWEKYFTVVQWDQRGTGRTYLRDGADHTEPLTIDRMTQDGVELAQYLTQRFHRKIILIGHSWGSILGVRMAQMRPDLIAAYVGTGQFVDKAEAEPILYDMLLARARAANDAQTVAKLQSLSHGDAKDLRAFVAQTWAGIYAPAAERALKARLNRAGLKGAGASSRDDKEAVRAGIKLSGARLSPQMARYDIRSTGLNFAVPFFVIQGDEDSQMPAALARQYFDAVHAPAKAYVALPGGGHFAVITMSDAFLRALVEKVRPLVK
jgi:pimeloyl-ACP methyl ester carboxylesterase